MKTKTCGECRYYFEQADFCRKNNWACIEEDKECCEDFKPKTNGDKIRQMSDEELARILINPPCFICSREVSVDCSDIDCKETILATLKQEAKDE